MFLMTIFYNHKPSRLPVDGHAFFKKSAKMSQRIFAISDNGEFLISPFSKTTNSKAHNLKWKRTCVFLDEPFGTSLTHETLKQNLSRLSDRASIGEG